MNQSTTHMPLPTADQREREALARLIAMLDPVAFRRDEPAAFVPMAQTLLASADECAQLLLARADMRDEDAAPAADAPAVLDAATQKWLAGVLAERPAPRELDDAVLQRLLDDPRLLCGYAIAMHPTARDAVRRTAGLPADVMASIEETCTARAIGRRQPAWSWVPVAAAAMISAVVTAAVLLQTLPTGTTPTANLNPSNANATPEHVQVTPTPAPHRDPEQVAVQSNTPAPDPAAASANSADAASTSHDTVRQLREQLSDPDPQIRAASAWHLVSYSPEEPAATTVLVNALADHDTRWIGQGGLMQLGSGHLPQIVRSFGMLPPARREAARDGLMDVVRLLGRDAAEQLKAAVPDLPADQAAAMQKLIESLRGLRDDLDGLSRLAQMFEPVFQQFPRHRLPGMPSLPRMPRMPTDNSDGR